MNRYPNFVALILAGCGSSPDRQNAGPACEPNPEPLASSAAHEVLWTDVGSSTSDGHQATAAVLVRCS
jgi:hypothetical protein